LGPNLEHGFLKDEDVLKTQLPDAIHASDIIAVVMKIKGVVSINEVLLTEYGDDGVAISGNSSKPWCLKLSGHQNPIFSTNKSRLQLYQKHSLFVVGSQSNDC